MAEYIPDDGVDRHQLQQIIAGLNDGVMLIAPSGTIVWANRAALTMHGCNHLSELGQTVENYQQHFLLHGTEQCKLDQQHHPVARLLDGEAFSDLQVEIKRIDDRNTTGVLEFSGLILTDSNGEPESLVLVMNDLTERVNAEQRFERTFATNPAPALILRLADSRFIKANEGFLEMSAYPREEAIGRPLHEIDILRHAQYRDAAIRALSEHSIIHQQESLLRTRNGGAKFVILAGQPIEVGEERCMLFTFNDLDARKQAETSLRESEERFNKAFRLAPVPMLVCRLQDWRITEINEAFTITSGYARETVIGQPMASAGLGKNLESLREAAAALRDNRSLYNHEIRWHGAGGDVLDGLLSTTPMTIQNEHCALFVLQDITERKRTEADMIAAIETVMKDTSWFTQTLMEKLAQIRHPGSHSSELNMLTRRERQVLEGICRGLDNAAIAQSLNLSQHTVRNHVANLYDKIGVNRRSAAVVWGRERGLGSY